MRTTRLVDCDRWLLLDVTAPIEAVERLGLGTEELSGLIAGISQKVRYL